MTILWLPANWFPHAPRGQGCHRLPLLRRMESKYFDTGKFCHSQRTTMFHLLGGRGNGRGWNGRIRPFSGVTIGANRRPQKAEHGSIESLSSVARQTLKKDESTDSVTVSVACVPGRWGRGVGGGPGGEAFWWWFYLLSIIRIPPRNGRRNGKVFPVDSSIAFFTGRCSPLLRLNLCHQKLRVGSRAWEHNSRNVRGGRGLVGSCGTNF